MADKLTQADRSRNMAAIRAKNTKPELIVRRLAHSMGYRYRLHRKDLPGKPDLVFGPRRKVIFIHGCFWHLHECAHARVPKSNESYWAPKLARNAARDAAAIQALETAGWQCLVIWECELKDTGALAARLAAFLTDAPAPSHAARPLPVPCHEAAVSPHPRSR